MCKNSSENTHRIQQETQENNLELIINEVKMIDGFDEILDAARMIIVSDNHDNSENNYEVLSEFELHKRAIIMMIIYKKYSYDYENLAQEYFYRISNSDDEIACEFLRCCVNATG